MNNYKYYVDTNPYVKMDGCNSLFEAFTQAEKEASYSGFDIKICDENGDTLFYRKWWSVPFDSDVCDNDDIISFGDYGYYDCWRDVDGNEINIDDYKKQ